MNEKKYKKRLDSQRKIILKQSEQIESLKIQIDELKAECEKKEKLINSISPLKNELIRHIADIKKCKEEYKALIEELRKMKEIINQTVYKGRWRLIKFLMK